MTQVNRFYAQKIIDNPMTNKTLGSTSARLLTALAKDNQTIFSIADAQKVLGSSYNATLQTLRRLTRAGWLVRLTAGCYAIVPLSSGDETTPHVNRYVVDPYQARWRPRLNLEPETLQAIVRT